MPHEFDRGKTTEQAKQASEASTSRPREKNFKISDSDFHTPIVNGANYI